jgi:adenine-specific DNA-methyltransferase
MATGESKKRVGKTVNSRQKPNGYSLAYEGKKSADCIISQTPSASISSAWRGKNVENKKLGSLYLGENLSILVALSNDESISGKVKLAYIDPPFATNKVFVSRNRIDAYEDLLTGTEYIEFMRERIIFIHKLLSPDGSIYIHIDQNMVFEMKLILDEIFGRKNFRNFIVRKKSNPKNYTRKQFGNISDYILFYTKTDKYTWNRPYNTWDPEAALKEYQYVESDTGRRFKKVPIHAPGIRNGDTGLEWKGMLPPIGKHWQYKRSTLTELDDKGEIFWSATGNPRRKIYYDQNNGIPIQDIWLDVKDAHNQNIKITGYPTEKNPLLLDRIIAASSNPGDLVLDCFAGSGTTLGSAAKLGRRWIGVDQSEEALQTTLTRFLHGLQPMGDFVSKPHTQADLLRNLDAELYLSTTEIYCDKDINISRYIRSQLDRLSSYGELI